MSYTFAAYCVSWWSTPTNPHAPSVMINLIFLTENVNLRKLCKRYYAVDDQGHFLESVFDIASDYRLTWKQILSVVRASCVALSTVHECEVCGEPKEFTARKEVRKSRSIDTYTCEWHQNPQSQEENYSSNISSSNSGDSIPNDPPLQKEVQLLADSLSSVSEKPTRLSREL